METKPYRIQSPEDIAKDYGGNKQKIAQAMQMGVVDPTAGVLAGMFIDRMRSAQMQEMAPQPSVAQQVMGGAPSVPPLAGGLGATSPAAPPMAPDMGMGMGMAPPMEAPMPEEAPMGMAAGGMFEAPYMKDGGLSELPIPDGMFDENRDGSYAGGGIVAFDRGGSTGGMSNLYDSVEYWESRGKQGAVSPKGARGVMQLMPGTMRDPGFGITPMQADTEEENRRVGQEYLDAMYRKYGDQATALAAYNWGPGNVDKWLKSGGDPAKLPTETKKYISNVMKGTEPPVRERDVNTTQGLVSSFGDIYDVINQRFAPTEEEAAATEGLRARAKEMASDEYYNKQRKDSMWETLATIGFNMASSKSPRLLQAVGEAAAAALPGAREDKKDRKALKDKALNLMVELGAKDRRDAMDKFKMAQSVFETEIAQKQFVQKMALSERELELGRDKLNAEIAAARNKGLSVNETVFGMYMSGDSAMKAAAEEWLRLNNPSSGTSGDAAKRTRDIVEGRDGTQTTVVDFNSLNQPK
jgi:hypothetical protein